MSIFSWVLRPAAVVLLALSPAAQAEEIRLSSTAIIDSTPAPAPNIPMGDADTLRAILKEGRDNNQVMNHLRHLTQEIGPRLTGSTRIETANKWCKALYEMWGLSNPHLEQWGTIPVRFDRGPSKGTVLLREEKKKDDGTTTAEYKGIRDMELTTLAWTAGTSGPVRGKVVRLPADEAAYAAAKDSLKGAWILMPAPPAIGQRGVRSRLSTSYEIRKDARKKAAEGKPASELSIEQRLIFEGVAGFISTTRDERVWTGGAPGWRELDPANIPPDVHAVVRLSDYDFINSRLTDSDPIEVELDLQHTLTPGPIPVYITVAEIRGTEKPDEVVIVSGHLDSWDGPGSQGCTDNGTGTVVTLEAARILAAVGARPKRTIRFIHWTGEEQGLLSSKAYTEMHKDELGKISAVFVDDGGTNFEGGLHAIETMVPMLAAATAPINEIFFDSVGGKALNVNVRTEKSMPEGGASDHAPFNLVGVPAFFWDEVGRADYGYGWHTQHDRYELAIPEYLKQSATCAAITAYQLACAPTLLPREVHQPEAKGPPPAKDGPKPASPTATPSK